MPGEEPEGAEWRTQPVSAQQHGERIDKVLVTLAPEFSRSHLQQLLQEGAVQLDGAAVASASQRVKAGQRVTLRLTPPAASRAFRPQAMPIPVVFEDEHLLVVDKPAGWVVHPAAGHWSGTLLNGLLAHHAGAATLPRAGIVHRLDKDTSGLMVVGKTLAAVTALVRDIAARNVQRHYLALAHGHPPAAEFECEQPVGRDPQVRVRMAVVSTHRGGRPARTDFRVLARQDQLCALACRLHTGRTHQIRVHLRHLGLPLVADATYGGKPALGLQRQALHARRLSLAHPVTGQALCFRAPLPPDLLQAWQALGAPEPVDD